MSEVASVPLSATPKHEKYAPLFELGRGGMASVVLAVHRGPAGFSKLVVIKKLRDELAGDPEFVKMFLEEAKLAARINHPNVVQTYEVAFEHDSCHIAMEYLEGQALDRVCAEAGKRGADVPLHVHLRILAQVLEGLHHAHELRGFDGTPLHVVHRDVSPQNVLVTYEGQVKVVDFGIAKAADSSLETRTGVLKGKIAYMAPEAFAGKADRRSDVFAVGAMLWRALTGRRLWKGMSDMEILQKLSMGEIPSPSTQAENLPPRLVEICQKALSPNADDRYQTAAALQLDLEEYLDGAKDRLGTREVGKYVSELFTEQRKKVAAAVESRFAQLGAQQASSDDVPLIPGALAAMRSSESDGALPTADASEGLAQGAARALAIEAGSLGTRPEPRSPTAMLLGVVALLVATGGGVTWIVKNRAAKRPTTTTFTSEQPTAQNEDAPETQFVELQLTLSPADAQVFVDDRQISPSERFARDGSMHRVRAAAAGRGSQAQVVRFDQSHIALTFNLERELVAAPPTNAGRPPVGGTKHVGSGTSTSAATPAETAATAAPTATGRAKPQLDSDDPWKH